MPQSGQIAQRRQGHIFADRQDLDQTVLFAVLGDDGQPHSDPVGHMRRADHGTAHGEPPPRMRIAAHCGFDKCGVARAHQPVDAQNFSGTQRQGHPIDRKPARGVGQIDLFGAEHLGAKGVVDGFREILAGVTDHVQDDPRDIDALHGPRPGDHPVTQDGDIVADADQFF